MEKEKLGAAREKEKLAAYWYNRGFRGEALQEKIFSGAQEKELVDNNLVSIIDGKKIGADLDFKKSFEKFSTSTNDALNERLFRKDGGMVSIFEMTRPINA